MIFLLLMGKVGNLEGYMCSAWWLYIDLLYDLLVFHSTTFGLKYLVFCLWCLILSAVGSLFITTKQNHFCVGRFDWEFIHVWYRFPLAVLPPRSGHWDKTPCQLGEALGRILRFGWAQLKRGADDIKVLICWGGGMAVCRKLLVLIQCGLVCPHKWLDGIWMFPGVEYNFRILWYGGVYVHQEWKIWKSAVTADMEPPAEN